MDDVSSAPSNGAGEVIAPAETPAPAPATVESPQPSEPAKTARDALERAFDSTEGAKEAADPGERPRNPDGTFATKPKEATKPEAAQTEPQPAPEKPKRTPPSRFAKEAQAVWEQTPEAVQAEIDRAINELTQGHEKYKNEATAYAELKQFAEEAKASGKTLPEVIQGYKSWENAFKQNPVLAFAHMLSNVGINPASVLQEGVLSGQQVQPVQPQAPSMEPLFNEVSALKQQLAEMQQRPIIEQVTSFAKESPFFDLLQNDIADNLRGQNEAGETPDLQKAYDAALAKYPDLAAVVAAKKAETERPVQPGTPPAEKPKTPEAHTRKAALPITGSPSGSDPASRKPAGSPREALERAAAQFTL